MLALTAWLGPGGCEKTEPLALPPEHVGQYRLARLADRAAYPDRIVRMHNLRRALDPDLPEDRRILSMLLLQYIWADEPDLRAGLASLAADSHSPPRLSALAARLLRMPPAGPAGPEVAAARRPGATAPGRNPPAAE